MTKRRGWKELGIPWSRVASIDTQKHLVTRDDTSTFVVPLVGIVQVTASSRQVVVREIIILDRNAEVFLGFFPPIKDDIALYRWLRRHCLREIIFSLGGTVDGFRSKVQRISLAGRPVGDAHLLELAPYMKNIQELTEIDLRGTGITDQVIASLAELEPLERVDLAQTHVSTSARQWLATQIAARHTKSEFNFT